MNRRVGYTFLVCLALLSTACTKESDALAEIPNIPEAENVVEVEQELITVVNNHRISIGYAALQYSPIAHEYANKHNDYMIAQGDLSHDNFSARASGIAAEVNAEYVGENVAKDYDTASEAFQGWLNSTSHKKTMEDEFTHTAVSVKKDASGNFYFTQLFYR
ncbi:CAP domain-containing protein [Ulvibacterium sp.]|uniref:CAP domain-containing protein n=1 Tax=Ulvibacterium sp. TaxID=2665914 RepID=UPI00261021F3|nr:CAP domain-containing protein [Ulvibacterium sp.]